MNRDQRAVALLAVLAAFTVGWAAGSFGALEGIKSGIFGGRDVVSFPLVVFGGSVIDLSTDLLLLIAGLLIFGIFGAVWAMRGTR